MNNIEEKVERFGIQKKKKIQRPEIRGGWERAEEGCASQLKGSIREESQLHKRIFEIF